MQILEKFHQNKKKEAKTIILITNHIKPRVAKIGYALLKKKYKVILLLKKDFKNELKKVDQSFFSYVIYFKEKEDLYAKCLLFSPVVYHIFTETVVSEWAEYLIIKKNILGKIVYDQYDIYRGFLTDKLDEVAKREKYCLENANGLCCRMFETQYLKQKFNYRFKGKRILFLDYCWNTYNFNSNKEHKSLRFVYGGRLIVKALNNRARYLIEFNGLEHIARVVQKNNASFAIVPSVSLKNSQYKSYRDLFKKYSHVILKEPMNFKDLINFESKMDYGIDCVELQSDIEKYYMKAGNYNIKIKCKFYATNKYFDYLDAGIMPIYGRKDELFGRYLECYGGAIKCSLEDLSDKINILRKEREINRMKALKAREIFAIENQIDRLLNFYNKI